MYSGKLVGSLLPEACEQITRQRQTHEHAEDGVVPKFENSLFYQQMCISVFRIIVSCQDYEIFQVSESHLACWSLTSASPMLGDVTEVSTSGFLVSFVC